jgi:hypothetical protein
LKKLTLISRACCHLCDDMETALRRLLDELPGELEILEVDADAELQRHYDELVPVLLGRDDGGESFELCHYFLDVETVRDHLSR